MTRPVKVAILGATGYGAGELLRLFTQHPAVEVVSVTSTSQVGAKIGDVHPHLRGFYDEAERRAGVLHVSTEIDRHVLLSGDHAVVFSALPHGASSATIDRLLGDREFAARIRIVDLSGDLRLSDGAIHVKYYPESPLLSQRRESFVYGLPELFRERIRSSRYIANPGCLATAAILAGAPLMTPDFGGMVAVDAKTGSSGSGRTLKETTHHPTRHADFRAYKPLDHQHEPEILQAWGDPHGRRVALSFVAQSMPTARGIFATAHLTLPSDVDAGDVRGRYDRFYADHPFVRVVDGSPALQDVVGSNFCDVGVACRDRQVIAMAAIDNLVKGMAGAAIQNMNLMCGLPETTGLWAPSFRPV